MVTEGTTPGFVQTSGGCDGGFGGSGWWGFLILAMMFWGVGGNGGFGNRGNWGDGDVWKAQEFGQLENSVRANGQGIADASWALNNSIKDGNFAIQREVDGVNQNLGNAICNSTFELADRMNRLGQQASECCCATQRQIDGVNFNLERNSAAINANTTAQMQKILDAIQQNKIEALQNKVNQLELKNELAGVVRYPNGFVYNAGQSPFCGCGNACGCAA